MVTTRHIRAGEELFTYYKYSPSGTFTLFPWYWELKEKTEEAEAGAENRFPAGLKGEDAEEPKREELAVAALPPPKTEPPTGLEAPPKV